MYVFSIFQTFHGKKSDVLQAHISYLNELSKIHLYTIVKQLFSVFLLCFSDFSLFLFIALLRLFRLTGIILCATNRSGAEQNNLRSIFYSSHKRTPVQKQKSLNDQSSLHKRGSFKVDDGSVIGEV